MPLYEATCGCGHRTEMLVRSGSSVTMTCSHCGQDMMKVPSVPSQHRMHSENPASPDNWRRHQEAVHDVMDIGRKMAIEQDVEYGSLMTADMGLAIRQSRKRFETPTGTGPQET